MIKHLLLAIVLTFSIGMSNVLNAQTGGETTKTKTITIKKGNSLDLLTAIRNPDTDDALNTYFGHVFPPATKHGFKVDASFVPISAPTKGNFHTNFVSFMTWPNKESRNSFSKEAEKLSYDYLSERRKIWSVFNLTEYENLKEDLEFTVSSDKVYVVTAYWVNDTQSFRNAKNNASKKMKAAGGKFVALLGSGKSPSGYLYEPDVISITEWDNSETFNAYLKSTNQEVNDAGTRNVNQWITKFLFK